MKIVVVEVVVVVHAPASTATKKAISLEIVPIKNQGHLADPKNASTATKKVTWHENVHKIMIVIVAVAETTATASSATKEVILRVIAQMLPVASPISVHAEKMTMVDTQGLQMTVMIAKTQDGAQRAQMQYRLAGTTLAWVLPRVGAITIELEASAGLVT